MALCGHSATQPPQPWHLAVTTLAAFPASYFDGTIWAGFGAHAAFFALRADAAVSPNQGDDRLDLPFIGMQNTRLRGKPPLNPEHAGAGMSFKPWQAPARKMPSVGLSIGRSLGWYSMNHPPGLWTIFNTELTVSTSGWGTAAWLSMTMSYSCSITLPSATSSEWTNRLWVAGSSVIRPGRPWMKRMPISRARS